MENLSPEVEKRLVGGSGSKATCLVLFFGRENQAAGCYSLVKRLFQSGF